ncbi:hypothetical protein LTR20_010649 [Exophiala xenobiotica]|nr:hypothetical protein LTS13_006811 [Exophiala xenobiotica]KAK5397523.1 hypothetical protein LTR79_005036 [Exophiala xenobiotica]KAK5410327.1 hypothetical protein LTR90_008508 [Exophiala xenobiotica]KAK5453747.1 hypothetical protein LTR20_010649 [Exophiala xenobiotica]KAK5475754.1 hypothetical protein LTR26_009094 [Exophiala xenobiotica]
MGVDAATAAAVAALIVSILAMTVAFAQVIQQYLFTGQLVRICDGVVYGKMPGRGRRIWTFSQFRFRVVYSMPQINLRTSLWIDSLPHFPSFSKSHLPLPDLRHTDHSTRHNFRQALSRPPGQQQYSEYSAVPGEASWVSFFRIAQNASGNDLFYDLIECDADRCPTDLTVAPMQVSLRDVVVVAIMAGMRCTDASFEKKSLAMEGAAGTITTSWHPLLGAITHFVPRNYSRPLDARSRVDDTLGLRIGDGSISPEWMARMWDNVVVAGRLYDLRDRRFYESYEGGSWFTVSNSRALVKASAPKSLRSPSPVLSYRLRSASPTPSFRRRRDSRASSRSRSIPATSPGFVHFASSRFIPTVGHIGGRPGTDIPSGRNDGEWWFASDAARSTSSSESSPPPISAENRIPKQNSPAQLKRPWYKDLSPFFRIAFDTSRSNVTEGLRTYDLESNSRIGTSKGSTSQPQKGHPLPSDKNRQHHVPSGSTSPTSQPSAIYPAKVYQRPQLLNAWKKLDGKALQDYIEERKKHEDSILSTNGRLLLTWPGEAGDEPETDANSNELGGWPRSALHLRQERSLFYVEKWRTIVNRRQHAREERDMQDEWEIRTHRSASRSSNVGQSERLRRYSPGPDRSLSRESRNSRPSSLSNNHNLQSRGPVSATKPAEDFHYRSQSPDVRHTSARSGSKEKVASSHIATGRPVAYGEESIRISRDPHTLAKANSPVRNDKQSPQRGRRQSNVESKFENHQDGTSPLPHSHPKDHQQKRRVRLLLPEHKDTEEADSANDNSSSSRESSVERLRADGDSMTQKEIGIPKSENVVDELVPAAQFKAGSLDNDMMQPWLDPPKGILKVPRDQFPEEENPVRESVAPLKPVRNEGIPPNARWTKISRALVNPEALERHRERFEAQDEYVIVLRVLSKDEILELAKLTLQIREAHEAAFEMEEHLRSQAKDRQAAHELESGSEGESSNADWSNISLFGSAEDSRRSESSTSMSESEDEHAGSMSRSSNKSQQQIPVSSDPQSSQDKPPPARWDTTSTNPTISIGDNTRVPSLGQPRRRRASTRSDISSLEGSDDDDDWSRWSQMGGPPALLSVNGAVPDETADSTESLGQGMINWFWISQADVLPGYFATPWHNRFSESTCSGAIMTMLVALEDLTENSTLRYVDRQAHCEEWVYQGKSTHPSYAINAMGGVIVSGAYTRVQFHCFTTRIPPIELLRSSEYQLNRATLERGSSSVVELLGELMGLDSWLSFCGRLPEIYNGRSNLIRSMPALVQKIMVDFEYEFSNLERTPTEGGLQFIRPLAQLILHTLEKEMLSEGEQLFAIVAVVRAAKMALCIVHGPSTVKLRDILVHDVQVYLV